MEDYIDDGFAHNDDDYEDNYDQDGCSSTDLSGGRVSHHKSISIDSVKDFDNVLDDENNDEAMYRNDYDKDVKDTHGKLGPIEVKTSKVNGELSAPHRQPLKVGHLQKFDPLENNFWKFG